MKEEIRKFIEKHIYREGIVISDSSNLFKDGCVDSLFAIQLLSFLESSYDIEVSFNDINEENFKSINAIVTYIEKKSIKI